MVNTLIGWYKSIPPIIILCTTTAARPRQSVQKTVSYAFKYLNDSRGNAGWRTRLVVGKNLKNLHSTVQYAYRRDCMRKV